MRRRNSIDVFKFVRFLLLVVLVGVLVYFVVSSCMNMKGRSLRVGLSESNPPLAYTDDKKNILGFEAEYARMLAAKLGKKPELKLYAPEDMAEALDSGAIDCVVSARQSVHDYLDKSYQTAEPFISYGLVFVISPSDDTMTGEEGLRGKRVGVIANSDAEQLSDELLKQYSFNVRLYDFERQPFQELELKKINVVIADELVARYMQIEAPESYRVLDTIYKMSGYGLRLSRKLTEQAAIDIEDAVISLKSDVETMDLFIRWFGADLS